ncbi:MAG TPA: isochorismate synthase [Candidatus Eisenbacteria bacterium]|nr:isochorismate synthase [Candidatus Eisenbacteria bacterium]
MSTAADLAPTAVRSVPVDLPGGLLDRLPLPEGVLAWVRDGEGLVGWGEAARFRARGPARFTRARDWWRRLAASWSVEDEVEVPGSGPVAFGTFTFDDGPGDSVLVVPRVVLGRRGGTTWLTTVGDAPRPATPTPADRPTGLRYAAGQTSVTAYRQAVQEAVGRIRRGALAKVVLAHDLVATADAPIDPRFLLAGLAGRYPGCWTYAVDGLVGATPELLVSRHGEQVLSRVLAGTAARGADPSDDRARVAALLSSGKDREEHRYAVDSLTEVLAPHCADLTVPDSPYVLELSNVAHLATDVTGRLADAACALDLAGALHPTAAVGGTPTGAAVRLLRELEGMDRGRYAAPVGWVDARGDGEWGIALRCAQLDGASARLFAGCGIVAESDPDAEVLEAQAKFVPMRDALEGVGH